MASNNNIIYKLNNILKIIIPRKYLIKKKMI